MYEREILSSLDAFLVDVLLCICSRYFLVWRLFLIMCICMQMFSCSCVYGGRCFLVICVYVCRCFLVTYVYVCRCFLVVYVYV
jgi:hypothetical protein